MKFSQARRRAVVRSTFGAAAGAVIGAIGSTGTGSLVRIARAQPASAWPPPLTRFVVPFPPGGPLDLLARTVGDALVAGGHKVVVENSAGGAGNIGIQQAARGPADGSVVLFVPQGNITINATLFPKLPFNWDRDFKPVTMLAETPNVLAVGPGVEAKTVAELIAWGKANPGKLTYASPGIGSSLHLIGELFKRETGVDMVHVPYKGTTPAMQDLAGGQIDLMFGALPTLAAQIEAGRIRALAVTTAKRSPAMPDVPTLAESGVANIDVPSWYGVMAPAAVPDATVTTIQQTIADVLKRPDIGQRLSTQGLTVVADTPAEFADRIKRETAQWAGVIKAANIKIDD